ncbi:MAG: restriction endonuclease subunit S [Endomicrobium sp.]|jgi:hypothetical protein|nr:restriction endonuclease subunit S [Endomicrobium sp.]
MNNLSDRKWKEFIVEDLFCNISNSKAYHKTNLCETKRGIAYISRTNLNNGFEAIVSNNSFKSNPKNSIVFGAENASFFYEPFEYITGNKMYVISDERINKYNGLFIQKMLNKSVENCGFGYGKGLIGTRVKKRSICLPVDDSGEPDWQFMTDYMKSKEQKLIKRYETYLSKINVGGGGGK